MAAASEITLTVPVGRLAGQMLAARRAQKAHEREAERYRLRARVAQLEIALTRASIPITDQFE